jgi:hypothetical protein
MHAAVMAKTSKRLRMNVRARTLISEALRSAKLERCGIAAEHKEAMRIYLDSWVVTRLELALEIIDGAGNGQGGELL